MSYPERSSETKHLQSADTKSFCLSKKLFESQLEGPNKLLYCALNIAIYDSKKTKKLPNYQLQLQFTNHSYCTALA